ncbi:MAG: 4-hydroxybenzoyl-CoA reductase [Chloroflexota bacterium]|nr:MAG: 4-hydroxybenzoyl-CoA reductase [Chloroflexota bacterium]
MWRDRSPIGPRLASASAWPVDSERPIWRRPTTLDEAIAARVELGDAALVVAGGTWVTLLIQQGLARPAVILSLDRIPGFDGIAVSPEGELSLGALCRLTDVARNPAIRADWSALADVYGIVANERIRNQGTVGGNVCEADYASDPPAALLALDARALVRGPSGERAIPMRDFFRGHYETAIAPDELLTAIVVPPMSIGARAHYLKFTARSSEDRPCAGIFAVVEPAAEDRVLKRVRIAIGAVSATPILFEAVNIELNDGRLADLAGEGATSIDPIADLRGSAAYRRALVRALVPRAIRAALADGAA